MDVEEVEKMESSKSTVIIKWTQAPPKATKERTVQAKIEYGVFEYIQNLCSNNKRSTRLIIFQKVSELYPRFKGGTTWRYYMKKGRNEFYYEFKHHFQLSYTRISGASRKLCRGCDKKNRKIIHGVGRRKPLPLGTESWFLLYTMIIFLIMIISQFAWTWLMTTHGVRRIQEDKKLGQGKKIRPPSMCICHAQRVERSYDIM